MSKKKDNKLTERPSEADEIRQIYRVAGYAFLLNLSLAVMKTFLAYFSDSLAITASTIDSATDAIASILIYVGVRLSTRKTRSFPMGLYKLENVASVVVALFIFIAGYEIIREILFPVGNSPRISLSYIIFLVIGTIATLLFGQYAISTGRKTESPTLIAEGRHRQTDVLSSLVVLVSVILSYFDIHWSILGFTIDQIGAVIIIIFIVSAGWKLLSDGMRVLLDASIDISTLDSIREIIKSEPLVSEIKALMGRNAGRFRFIQATITLKTENLEKAHRISDEIERKIRNQITHVEKVIIHYGPEDRTHDRIAIPLEDEKGHISAHFGEAHYFCIVYINRKNRGEEKREIIENPHRSVETAKGIRVAEWLVERGVDHIGIKEQISHKGPGYVFSNGSVKIHIIKSNHIDLAVNEIIADGL